MKKVDQIKNDPGSESFVNPTIFLISILSIDKDENTACRAVSYQAFGYLCSKEEAVEFCNKGKTFTDKDCWAISKSGMKEYIYAEVPLLVIK